MRWQLRDPQYRSAIHETVRRLSGRCALVGPLGVQVHLAHAVGLDKLGPPARAVELVSFSSTPMPRDLGVPVVSVDALGFEASIEAERQSLRVDGEEFLVARPEHILGISLASAELPPDVKWACFILMRTYEGQLDLEQARGFLKRSDDPDRQALLAELAYLAA